MEEELARVRARAAQIIAPYACPIDWRPLWRCFWYRFAWLAFATRFEVSRIGAVIIAISCIAIPLRLRAAQRSAPDFSLSLKAMLRADWQVLTRRNDCSRA